MANIGLHDPAAPPLYLVLTNGAHCHKWQVPLIRVWIEIGFPIQKIGS
jgi:hypothetical protein